MRIAVFRKESNECLMVIEKDIDNLINIDPGFVEFMLSGYNVEDYELFELNFPVFLELAYTVYRKY